MATLNVNGTDRQFTAEPETPLLWVLREQLGLTGTKYGCGIAVCGACTVHLDGEAIRSCMRPVSTIGADAKIVTIEGLSPDGSHPVQKAWVALDVPQCGFCQSGMVMAAAALLKATPNPTDADIDAAMTNICRCGTYNRVRAAIQAVGDGVDPAKRATFIEPIETATPAAGTATAVSMTTGERSAAGAECAATGSGTGGVA